MSEYYGVSTPSYDFIAHYGIKGMKWGVRKAIEKGNSKSLDRHYKKAAKKLEKLSKRADIEVQNRSAKRWGKASLAGLGVAGLGIGGVANSSIAIRKSLNEMRGLNAHHQRVLDDADKKLSRLMKDSERRLRLTAQGGKYNSYRSEYERQMAFDRLKKDFNKAADDIATERNLRNASLKMDLDKQSAKFDKATKAGKISSLVGVAGLLASSAAGGKALAAKYRTTAKGHAKAVADRDAWANEMNKVFAGTKYSKKHRR